MFRACSFVELDICGCFRLGLEGFELRNISYPTIYFWSEIKNFVSIEL